MKELTEIKVNANILTDAETDLRLFFMPETLHISEYPVDRYDCDCQKDIYEKKKNLIRGYYQCPASKNKTLYKIICNNCGEQVAFVNATNNRLSGWANLHYVYRENENGKKVGCFTINISPLDQSLGIECSCGNDTRDFRPNRSLPKHILDIYLKKTSIGREFGKPDSQFRVEEA